MKIKIYKDNSNSPVGYPWCADLISDPTRWKPGSLEGVADWTAHPTWEKALASGLEMLSDHAA